MISQHLDCLNTVERFQGEYHIVLEPSLHPIVDPTRRVTISLKDHIKKELDKKCHYSEDRMTQWFNRLVYRRMQNKSLRLHLNAKDFNAAIQIEHHIALTLEEILLYLKDARVFSIREKICGYRDVVLGKESINLTTFGRYRFRRMPFRLKMSQEVFQTKMDQTFEGQWLDFRVARMTTSKWRCRV